MIKIDQNQRQQKHFLVSSLSDRPGFVPYSYTHLAFGRGTAMSVVIGAVVEWCQRQRDRQVTAIAKHGSTGLRYRNRS